MLQGTEINQKTTFIFDFFHTLTEAESKWGNFPWTSDYLGIDRNVWGEYLQNHSRERLTGKIRASYDIIKHLVGMIDPSIPDEKVRFASEFRVKRFANAVLNIPTYVVDTLSVLKSKRKKIGLISNADCTELSEWPNSPIVKYFDSTIISCEIGMIKPDSEIYMESLRTLGSLPEETLFIGDGGSRELEGAKKCGLATVMVEGIVKEFLAEAQLEKRRMYADYRVQFIDELLNM